MKRTRPVASPEAMADFRAAVAVYAYRGLLRPVPERAEWRLAAPQVQRPAPRLSLDTDTIYLPRRR